MFGQLDLVEAKRGKAYLASAAVHCLVVVWLFHSPVPTFVAPSLMAKGDNGTLTTYVYWPVRRTDSFSSRPASQRSRLTWRRRQPAEESPKKPTALAETEEETQSDQSQPRPGLLAGSPYGSMLSGRLSGQEVRPALRISGSEPRVAQTELDGLEGSVVVEITIDERGHIIEKKVIQSLAPGIDGKVLAAIEDWRFLPATRDGIAIPSKEDVYYHFPVRR
jgi:TonB family protein